MSKIILNIKKFVIIMSELIKWPTMQAVINNIVHLRFCFILFFEFKLTLLCNTTLTEDVDCCR